MPTLFTRIIRGEIPSYKVAEDAQHYAFLDIRPLTAGHTLVVPKKEADYLFDLDDETYRGLFLFAKRVAIAIKKAVPCARIGMTVIGLEVPHAHIHLIPINSMADMDFGKERVNMTAEEMKLLAEKIGEKIF